MLFKFLIDLIDLISKKSQAQNLNFKMFGVCDLMLGICLEIGAWKLEFHGSVLVVHNLLS